MAQKPQSDKPFKQFRSGALAVAIWRREHKDGYFFTVTPSRSYLDGDEWKYSDSLNEADLPIMSQLLNMAFSWITVQRQLDREKETAGK
jgi:hypothetical protein